tara:strand:- start:1067 stop:3463 length:2397 start_codon:yes stop_codon:yes gene_type:complete
MKKITLVLMLFSLFVNSQIIQEQHQRAKIYYSSFNELALLDQAGIPVDHGVHKKHQYFISDFSISEISKIREAGFKVDILIEDSKQHFLAQNAISRASERNLSCSGGNSIDYQTPVNFELGSMGGYFTYQEMLDELDQMKALYPDLITTKENISNFVTEGTLDNSTTPPIGGNGIKWVKISDNPNSSSEGEPQILHTAIHHAREPASLSQLIFYMWYLLENYESDLEIQSIVNNTELFFVPVVNPDGYLYNQKTDPNGGGFWRKNRKDTYGTDLNRNYNYYIDGDSNNPTWGGEGTSSDTSSDIYHGTGPFSEIETQAIKWFVENHNFVMAFNNHTYGNLLLYPYGYTDNALTPENDLFVGISNELVSQNGFNNMISSGLYPAAGASDDFMYGTIGTHNKIYSFTPEIGPSFWPPSSQIESICKSMMYLNVTAAKMVNNYATATDTSSNFVGDLTTVDFTFDIKRLGIAGDGNFTVSLNPISSNISSVGNPENFNSLTPLEIASGSINYQLDPSIEVGDSISFELIVNNGSYDSTTIITKTFGSLAPIFTDPGNSVNDNFTNNGWDITTNTFVSPSSSITDSPNENYQNNQNKSITISNEIDLTNAIGATLNFYAKWDIENNWDYVQIEVSTNNGNSWVPQCGQYTNDGSSNNGQPTGEPLYDGTQSEWVLEQIDLSDYLGENILVRFQFQSDGEVVEDGFYFDDLTVNVIDDGTLNITQFSASNYNIYPNPVSNLLNIETLAINYSIQLFNLQGQLMKEIKNASKNQSIDYSGYSKGIYLMKLTSDSYTKTFKVIKK